MSFEGRVVGKQLKITTQGYLSLRGQEVVLVLYVNHQKRLKIFQLIMLSLDGLAR